MRVFRVEHPDYGVGPYQVPNVIGADISKCDVCKAFQRETGDEHAACYQHEEDIFRFEELYQSLEADHSSDPNRSVPSDEQSIAEGAWGVNNYRSACHSVESLQEWFSGHWEAMRELGFNLATYEVEDEDMIECAGNRQVLFNPDNAKLIDSFPL